MSARTKARKRALDILFSAQLRGQSFTEALHEAEDQALAQPARSSSFPYAREIVDGFIAHRASIDELLGEYSDSWTLDRMPAVDLAILRMAAWEILYNDDVPTAVSISEAGNFAAELSTDSSRRFVTGVLTSLSKAESSEL
ncbi:MAG: transcription antitermination factor NusB [Microbacteriaceae bacterium]|nr:transcription antitermination factor NusB [Microbacteriaceae bacterium]MCI1206767.1 transcription antitermination factor NusB [Microbacteriaceae bacterium]